MTTPKVKCVSCGYEGEHNSEIYGGICSECAKKSRQEIEITKIKSVLVALWRGEPNPLAQAIVDKFTEELNEIERGN